jgi:invasion protein IalB
MLSKRYGKPGYSKLRWLLPAAAAMAVGAAGVTPAQAQQDFGGGWNKFCSTDAQGRQGCSVVYQLLTESGQFVAQISVNQVTGQEQIIFSIWIRTNVLIEPGISVRVDQGTQGAIPYVLCDPNICIGEAQVDVNFVNSLKRGGTLMVSTVAPAADAPEGVRQQNYPITLRGFTAAYDGPGLTPAQAQARRDELNQALQDRAEQARQRLIDAQRQALEGVGGIPPAP